MPSVFTRIIQREIPSNIVYEDDICIVIHDINPQAKIHLLLIPKKEIETVDHILPEDIHIIGHLFAVAQKVTRDMKIESWYKLHFNVGKLGWQEVAHVHMHLLSDLA